MVYLRIGVILSKIDASMHAPMLGMMPYIRAHALPHAPKDALCHAPMLGAMLPTMPFVMHPCSARCSQRCPLSCTHARRDADVHAARCGHTKSKGKVFEVCKLLVFWTCSKHVWKLFRKIFGNPFRWLLLGWTLEPANAFPDRGKHFPWAPGRGGPPGTTGKSQDFSCLPPGIEMLTTTTTTVTKY